MSEARIFYQEDCDLSLLNGKTIAIIGYGSQAVCIVFADREFFNGRIY